MYHRNLKEQKKFTSMVTQESMQEYIEPEYSTIYNCWTKFDAKWQTCES